MGRRNEVSPRGREGLTFTCCATLFPEHLLGASTQRPETSQECVDSTKRSATTRWGRHTAPLLGAAPHGYKTFLLTVVNGTCASRDAKAGVRRVAKWFCSKRQGTPTRGCAPVRPSGSPPSSLCGPWTADQRALRRPQSWVVRAPSRARGCFGRDPAATRNRRLCSGLSNDSRGPITWFYGSAEAVASKSRGRPPDGCNSHLFPSLPLCLQRTSVPHPCPCKVSAKVGPSERALVCRG